MHVCPHSFVLGAFILSFIVVAVGGRSLLTRAWEETDAESKLPTGSESTVAVPFAPVLLPRVPGLSPDSAHSCRVRTPFSSWQRQLACKRALPAGSYFPDSRSDSCVNIRGAFSLGCSQKRVLGDCVPVSDSGGLVVCRCSSSGAIPSQTDAMTAKLADKPRSCLILSWAQWLRHTHPRRTERSGKQLYKHKLAFSNAKYAAEAAMPFKKHWTTLRRLRRKHPGGVLGAVSMRSFFFFPRMDLFI